MEVDYWAIMEKILVIESDNGQAVRDWKSADVRSLRHHNVDNNADPLTKFL